MRTEELKNLLKTGALRSLKMREGVKDLASNDYLGLSLNPSFQKAVLHKWEQWCRYLPQKVGSTGSRLLTGNHRFFEETEAVVAKLHGFSSATPFNCGYMANLALLTSACSEEDTIIADLHVHASLHDGIKLSKARGVYFRHNDLNHLEWRLKQAKGKCFVVVESLYSMGGDFAPLQEIVNLCERHGAFLIVDEAHAIGMVGKKGKGLVASLDLQENVFACMGAFGKALGAHGAALLGASSLKPLLLNLARPLIYTTSLALPTLAAIRCSYDFFPKMEKERERVAALCRQFSFSSHIHPIPLRGNALVKWVSQCLYSRGFDVRPILSPTVPRGKEMLRMIVHAFNKEEEIATCLELIKRWRSP